jgi:hypothetical protein
MPENELLDQIRGRQIADLRAYFPDLAERDLMLILGSKPEHAVYVLQQCFDCDMEDAKAAWNDYVLRYVDGPSNADGGQAPHSSLPPARLS